MKKFVEVKSANVNGIFQVLANKGVCWQVQNEVGETFMVQKKQVVRGPWEEPEDGEEEAATVEASPTSLAGQLAAANGSHKETKAKGTAERKTREHDPDVVTLKELCADLDIEPRIARRKLRKAVGHVGTGARWEWTKGSDELAAVRQALAGAPEPVSAE